MTCAGHIDIHTDLCASCRRYAPDGRHAPAVQHYVKGPAQCLDYQIEAGELEKFNRELPF